MTVVAGAPADELRLLDRVAALPREQRRAYVSRIAEKRGITVDQAMRLIRTSWEFTARPKQLPPPGDWWSFWFLMAGRGFGKTISGAEWAAAYGRRSKIRFALVAPTLGEVRSTMVEGETGLLSVLPAEALLGRSRQIAWNKSLLELTLANGTLFKGFSSEVPDRLRGPQHHGAWCEEVSSWEDANKGDELGSTWSNLKLGLRLGVHPRAVLTSTPKANKLTNALVQLAGDTLALVKGSSYENRDNLSEAWWTAVVSPLEGTRTGRQEIMAELLEDVEGALWTRATIDASRVPGMAPGWQNDPARRAEWAAKMVRIVVGVDPNTTSGESADNAGVIVSGIGEDGHGYVLDDRSITRGGPRAWSAAAVDAYHDWAADRIVAESNNGGEMVELTIKGFDPSVPVKLVTASRGKRTRAEPIAALYVADPEHEKVATVHHVGVLPLLEDELTTWTPADESPGRLDAAVWGLTDLRVIAPPQGRGSHVAKGDIPGVVPMGEGVLDSM